jgi:hypothetical protein
MGRFLSFLACLALITPTLAHPCSVKSLKARSDGFSCGHQATPEFLAASAEMAAHEANQSKRGLNSRSDSTAAKLTVDTYFHVIAKAKNASAGYIPKAQMDKQIAVINENYAPWGVHFDLKGVDWTVNPDWAVGSDHELEMKTALRKGDYKTLNVYFQYDIGEGLLGVSPSNQASYSNYLTPCRYARFQTPLFPIQKTFTWTDVGS